MSLISIHGLLLIVHGFPTSQLGANAQPLSVEDRERLLAKFQFEDHRQFQSLNKPQRSSGARWKNERNRLFEAIRHAQANDQSPDRTRRHDLAHNLRTLPEALGNLLGCSRQMARTLLVDESVEFLGLSNDQIPPTSSSDPTSQSQPVKPF
jgi:hypothetical protein